MHKKTLAAVAIVAVLAVIVALIFWGGGADDEQTRREFSAVPELSRVEIMPPADGDGPELLVFERRQNDQWWMSRPEEAPVRRRWSEALDSLFRQPIATDDLVIAGDQAASYGLADDQAVRLDLFSAQSDRAALELMVGKEITVVETGAVRTFVRPPGGGSIYRAHRGLGELVRLEPAAWIESPSAATEQEEVEQQEAESEEDRSSADPAPDAGASEADQK